MSDPNCDNLPPDFPGYSGFPGASPDALIPPGSIGGAGFSNRSPIEISQLLSQAAINETTKRLNSNTAEQRRLLLEDKKRFFTQKQRAQNCTPITIRRSNRKRKTCRCPVCHPLNRVRGKVAGKKYFKIPFTNFKIPRVDYLLDSIGLGQSYDSNRRKGEVCGACNGRKYIEDVHDDSEAYGRVAQSMSANAEKIMDVEAKLGLGGTRTTIIQGSDLLFVGLGFNNNKTSEVVPEGAIAPSMRGGKIPQQSAVKTNAVVGKQGSLAWPQQVGNYTIKCANKFNLLAGAGGITIATPGPLTFSAGTLRFVGPQLSLGSSTGPLTLEGDSVNITGKAISVTPTGGELFVKGNINNTGNITTQGHAHFESVSFAKAMCVGTKQTTDMANGSQDVTITQPATWYPRALQSALLDLQTYYQNVLADTKTSAFRLLSPKENINISDRITSMVKLAIPLEEQPTAWILPGMCNVIGIGNLGAPVVSTNPAPIPVWNMPHIHGIPESMHHHEVMLPDINYNSGDPKALRSKVLNGAHESGVPADPTRDTASRLQEAVRTGIEFTYNIACEGVKVIAKAIRLS